MRTSKADSPRSTQAWRRWAIFGYVALLIASTAYRWLDLRGSRPIVDYDEWSTGEGQVGSSVVLLHGARGARHELREFAETMAKTSGRRVLAPDLPGFDDSLRSSDGDGAEAAAARLSEWLQSLGEANPHLVAFGYGGAVALEMTELKPEGYASVALINAVISPKFELLGDPTLNKALKASHFAAVWLGSNALPHFGWLERGPASMAGARLAWATNMDAAEDAFERCRLPVFLAGGDREALSETPSLLAYQAALPGSLAQSYAGYDHELLDLWGGELAQSVSEFLTRVETSGGSSYGVTALGTGETFDALSGRQLQPMVAGILLATATFASEDLACIGGGLLAAQGAVSLWMAVAGCLVGIAVGDFAIFLIGRTFGVSALRLPGLRKLAHPGALNRYGRWFERRGLSVIILTRFLPGSRVPTYFSAGVAKVGAVRFAGALIIASAIWTPIVVGSAYALGPRFMSLFEGLGAAGWIGMALAVFATLLVIRIAGRALTWRGRRLLLSRWLRWRHWEHWPMWALYAPVAVYIGWLMLRYRSIALPTALNPCMLASGLVYESKSEILAHLEKHGAPVAEFSLIPLNLSTEEKLDRLRSFMEERATHFPVVLKPDVGQRGQGVMIAHGFDDARRFFDSQVEASIAQVYVPGVEYGVFYERALNDETGRITSITDKRMVEVIGDGASTLERLILRDERAVRMAPFFLKRFEEKLDWVPRNGEIFSLTDVGTHCRGALFLDGSNLLTPALAAAVDGFSRNVGGFHFGRYDLRAPSADAFARGERIQIIELNGLTSEPTSMYDPRHSIFFAWRALMAQWARIFSMAQRNRAAGFQPVSIRLAAKLVWRSFRGAPSPSRS